MWLRLEYILEMEPSGISEAPLSSCRESGVQIKVLRNSAFRVGQRPERQGRPIWSPGSFSSVLERSGQAKIKSVLETSSMRMAVESFFVSCLRSTIPHSSSHILTVLRAYSWHSVVRDHSKWSLEGWHIEYCQTFVSCIQRTC